jgi:hypothetical protein
VTPARTPVALKRPSHTPAVKVPKAQLPDVARKVTGVLNKMLGGVAGDLNKVGGAAGSVLNGVTNGIKGITNGGAGAQQPRSGGKADPSRLLDYLLGP